ncbi:microtubule-associated protein Jupiter-like [Euwallacea fornicatus]|uniref:microtubule-associated protein Jupiter-like n=1 Tax=Euwallacea fornicatus TaxID=995702 RepID=UPI00338EAD50
MTSTQFNIGLTTEKNSSRVLRPPGGGHNDIFGIGGQTEKVAPSGRRHHPQSTISSCFLAEAPNQAKQTENECVIEKKGHSTVEEHVSKGTGTDEKDATEGEENGVNGGTGSSQEVVSHRVRVPPGGFSSALW